MAKELKRADIVLYSKKIKELLKKRFEELELTYGNIINDAIDHGYTKISKANLSIYFNFDYPVKNAPTQETILWLCLRYGIKIMLKVEELEYNEEECLIRLKKVFK